MPVTTWWDGRHMRGFGPVQTPEGRTVYAHLTARGHSLLDGAEHPARPAFTRDGHRHYLDVPGHGGVRVPFHPRSDDPRLFEAAVVSRVGLYRSVVMAGGQAYVRPTIPAQPVLAAAAAERGMSEVSEMLAALGSAEPVPAIERGERVRDESGNEAARYTVGGWPAAVLLVRAGAGTFFFAKCGDGPWLLLGLDNRRGAPRPAHLAYASMCAGLDVYETDLREKVLDAAGDSGWVRAVRTGGMR